MSKVTIVVMAAGIGSRYGGIKQLDAIGTSAETIIDYSLYDALRAGFTKVVFIIRREIERPFREKIGKRIEKRVETDYVFQELDNIPQGFTVPPNRNKPWGTGHAVMLCKDRIREPFGVINADDYYGAKSFKILADFLKKSARKKEESYLLVGYLLKNTLSSHGAVSRALCLATPEGYLREIDERLKVQKFGTIIKYALDEKNWVEVSPETPVSMNMWGFLPSLFGELEVKFSRFLEENIANNRAEFLIPEVVSQMVREKKVRVKILFTPERWFGISYREDKLFVEKAIRELSSRGIYPKKLWP